MKKVRGYNFSSSNFSIAKRNIKYCINFKDKVMNNVIKPKNGSKIQFICGDGGTAALLINFIL